MEKPLDMLIFCPACGKQHVDKPQEQCHGLDVHDSDKRAKGHAGPCMSNPMDENVRWTNPPHRSHLCLFCGSVFRLADVPTNGVIGLQTVGKHDTWTVDVGDGRAL